MTTERCISYGQTRLIFNLDGAVNTQNCRIWGSTNPHAIQQQPLHSPYVTAWYGFTANFILGPDFFEKVRGNGFVQCTVTSDRYARLLEEHVVPALRQRGCLATSLNSRWSSGKRLKACHLCAYSTKSMYHLKRHMMSHTGDKPFLCSLCGKGFNRKEHLKRHQINHCFAPAYGGSAATYVESFSFFETFDYDGSNNEVSHNTSSDEAVRSFKCLICTKAFKLKHHLKCHMLVHTKERPFKCTLCDKSFQRSSNLKYHIATHSSG
ncbi:zinc finger protein 257-like [Uloborus diversus]|uniref:zinc finger protein 257-like n=1 Tax=Uloborus diversus TaxID=327109 RepID=UPI00240A6E27|nr:zinc finger protein 257-like [Uloborus diversus]